MCQAFMYKELTKHACSFTSTPCFTFLQLAALLIPLLSTTRREMPLSKAFKTDTQLVYGQQWFNSTTVWSAKPLRLFNTCGDSPLLQNLSDNTVFSLQMIACYFVRMLAQPSTRSGRLPISGPWTARFPNTVQGRLWDYWLHSSSPHRRILHDFTHQ